MRSKAIDADLVVGAVLNLKDSTFETFEGAKSLIGFLDARLALKKKLAQTSNPLSNKLPSILATCAPTIRYSCT